MSTTVKTQISVKSSGDGVVGESEWKPTILTNTVGAAAGPVAYALATGGNDITVPTGTKGFTVMPAAASIAVLKIKGGSGGGTGFAFRAGYPFSGGLPTGTVSVHIDSSTKEDVYIHWG